MKIPPTPIQNARGIHANGAPESPNGTRYVAGYSPGELSGVELAPIVDDLTPEERARFHFFRDEMKFVKDLTDISESLRCLTICPTFACISYTRSLERDLRKDALKNSLAALKLPTLCYLPLNKSVDSFKCVLRPIPEECHAFTTKARCPALILFELEEHPDRRDVASFEALELTRNYEDPTVLEVDTPEETAASKFKRSNGGSPVNTVWREDSNVIVERIFQGAVRFLSVGRGEATTQDRPEAPIPEQKTAGSHVSLGDKAETFDERSERLRLASKHGDLPGWRLGGLLAKSNDDVRQEVFVMQVWNTSKNPLKF